MQCTERKIIPISLCEEALMAPQINHKIWPYTDKLSQSEWKKDLPTQTNQGNQTAERSHQFCLYTWSWPRVTKDPIWRIMNKIKSGSNILIDSSCLIGKVWKILSLKLWNHLLFSNWKVCRMPTEQNPNCWDKWQIKILKARSFLWAKIMAISSKPGRPRK